MKYIVAQIIGAIAFIILGISYFKKQKKGILFLQILSYIFFCIHYYLQDGLTAAICNIVGLVALVVIYLFDKYQLKNKALLVIGLIPIFIAILILTYKNIFSVFPVLASIFTISSFLAKSERIIRGIGIVSAVCWLAYAIVLRSPVTIICEVFTLVAVTSAFIKNEKAISKAS